MKPVAPLIGAALLSTGCVHTPTVSDALGVDERNERLAAIADWNLSGRLIVDTGERRDSMSISLEQRGARLQLTIRGAVIGAGSIRVAGDAAGFVIEGRGQTRVLADPEADLSRELDWPWPLPVMSLDSWLLGLPDAAYPAREDRGPTGTLATLRQRDWRIDYDEYQLAGGLLVPGEMTLTRERLELRLAGIRWAPAPSEP
jgi:outer membrane biogenesis lipoprotein LolB